MRESEDYYPDEFDDAIPEKENKSRKGKGKKEAEKPVEAEVIMDPSTDRRYRMETNLQMALIDAYGRQPDEKTEAKIANASLKHSTNVSTRLNQEHLEPDAQLLERVNQLVAMLSSKSEVNFVLSRGTINAVKRSMKRSGQFNDVQFRDLVEYPYIEKEMIKAAGGQENLDTYITNVFGQLFQGSSNTEIRRAFIALERAEELIHDTASIDWKAEPEKSETESYDPETVNLILKEQNFSSSDLVGRPWEVGGVMQLMEISKKWPALDDKERGRVLMVMARVAQHFNARLLTGPEGPFLFK